MKIKIGELRQLVKSIIKEEKVNESLHHLSFKNNLETILKVFQRHYNYPNISLETILSNERINAESVINKYPSFKKIYTDYLEKMDVIQNEHPFNASGYGVENSYAHEQKEKMARDEFKKRFEELMSF
jgi:hypothetical protein